jgi:uncharacterized membrane protein YkvA (DUF1232 family)
MKYRRKIKKYAKYYSEGDFLKKLSKVSGKLSSSLLYYFIILYYLVSDKNIPLKTRLIFIAALGYFILPSDLVADVIPGLGFTDDLAFVTYAFSTANDFITPELKAKAQERVERLLNQENKGLAEDLE